MLNYIIMITDYTNYTEIPEIPLTENSSVLIHLFRKKDASVGDNLMTHIDINNIDIEKLISKNAKSKNIIHVQFKDLCMEISDEKKFFSQKRNFVTYNSNILVETIEKTPIESLCFPNLKNYPIYKNFVRIEDTIVKNLSSTIVIEKNISDSKDIADIADIYVHITDINELEKSCIKKLLKAVHKKITSN
jgi:hypothetical protein